MRDRLNKIRMELVQMRTELQADDRLPPPSEFLDTTIAFNEMRSAMVALDIALYARHKKRHPFKMPETDLSPTQPLDAETRAEIDTIP
jgi:hypothetical protein